MSVNMLFHIRNKLSAGRPAGSLYFVAIVHLDIRGAMLFLLSRYGIICKTIFLHIQTKEEDIVYEKWKGTD